MDEYRLPPQISEGHINDGTHLFPLTEQQLNNSPIAEALKVIGAGLADVSSGLVDLGNAAIEKTWEACRTYLSAAAEGIKEAFSGKDKEAPKPEPQKESLGKALFEGVKAAIDGAKEGIEQANQKTKEQPLNTKDLKDRLIAQHREQERQKSARESQKVEIESKANPQPRQASMRPAESSRYERTH